MGPSSSQDECIIGVYRCGCITYANAAPDRLDRDDERALAQIVRGGGSIERLSVEDARGRPFFLVGECPHDPKGWEREIPKEPDPIRYSQVGSRNLSVVYVRLPRWPTGFRGGEVGKRDGLWWATEGWLDHREATATDGHEPRGPVKVLGPFTKQREAAEALIPLAQRRSAAFAAEMDAERELRRSEIAVAA
jgi:hypothetical protein